MLNTKKTISQKLKIARKKTHELKYPFQNNTHLLERMRNILRYAMSQKLKITKIGKLIFLSLRIFHINMAISEGGRGGDLHIDNWDRAQ